jgi:chemotaxis signal transduction protein
VTDHAGLEGLAERLRRDFDDAFTRAHAPDAPPHTDILVIGIAEHRYALRLADVAELLADRAPVSVPTSRPDLLGLVAVRGAVLPVYDLASQLGLRARDAPRWLVRSRTRAPFAAAFERFERHARVPSSALSPVASTGVSEFVRASVRLEHHHVPVLELPAIVESVTRRPAPQRTEEP